MEHARKHDLRVGRMGLCRSNPRKISHCGLEISKRGVERTARFQGAQVSGLDAQDTSDSLEGVAVAA
jgi:hypothetical protein